jgi:putative sporulation protein YyaC
VVIFFKIFGVNIVLYGKFFKILHKNIFIFEIWFINKSFCLLLLKGGFVKEFGMSDKNLKDFAYEIYLKLDRNYRPVFLCVGSDKFVCDSLAPIVGELLTKKYNINAYVYGSLEYNINAHNLTTAINYIESEHPYSQIILIDATLGEDVGNVKITNGAYVSFGNLLPIKKTGDFSILGIVGKKGQSFNLNSTRLGLVYSLANFIAKGIVMANDVVFGKFSQSSKIIFNCRN